MTLNRNKVTSCIIAGFTSFVLTTSAYAVVSTATPPSVGFKPIATQSVTATGALGPNETISLSDFGLTDADGDLLDATETMKTVQWYIMDGSSKTDLGMQGDSAITIPADAAGKKLGLKYTVKTLTGTPNTAHEETDIILTVANGGGITGGGSGGEIGRGLAVDPDSVTVTFTSSPTLIQNGIEGTNSAPIVGVTELSAELVCVAGTSCDESDFIYTWLMGDAGETDTSKFTPVALDGNGKTYTPKTTEQNKAFAVDVKAKTATP